MPPKSHSHKAVPRKAVPHKAVPHKVVPQECHKPVLSKSSKAVPRKSSNDTCGWLLDYFRGEALRRSTDYREERVLKRFSNPSELDGPDPKNGDYEITELDWMVA